MRIRTSGGTTCWCSVGNDLPGVENEPEGDEPEGDSSKESIGGGLPIFHTPAGSTARIQTATGFAMIGQGQPPPNEQPRADVSCALAIFSFLGGFTFKALVHCAWTLIKTLTFCQLVNWFSVLNQKLLAGLRRKQPRK